MLRACVRAQLDATLDLPMRKHIQRAVHLDSLKCLFSTVDGCLSGSGFKEHDLRNLMVIYPFETELAILRKENYAIESAVASYNDRRVRTYY